MREPVSAGARTIAFLDGALDPARWIVVENLACLESIPSSNDLARELIDFYFQEEQTLPPTLLVAEAQPAARGRAGREWKAPAGRGIYLTLVRMIPKGDPASLLQLAVALWVREAIRESCGLAARLKWPNDLYVGRQKLAGVLVDARTQGEEAYAAIGIGVNVRGRAVELGVAGATTIEEETGRPVPVAPVLQAVVDRIDAELSHPRWDREIDAWEEASVHQRGDPLTVSSGGRRITGRFAGLDPSGFLRLAGAGGEEVVTNGELVEW